MTCNTNTIFSSTLIYTPEGECLCMYVIVRGLSDLGIDRLACWGPQFVLFVGQFGGRVHESRSGVSTIYTMCKH